MSDVLEGRVCLMMYLKVNHIARGFLRGIIVPFKAVFNVMLYFYAVFCCQSNVLRDNQFVFGENLLYYFINKTITAYLVCI